MSTALSASKARLILHHGYVHDRSGRRRTLTPAQQRYLGAIASGYAPWSVTQRRAAMKATARHENPGLTRALWKGVKRGYHEYRATGYEAKAARHRRLATNPRMQGTIPGRALEIRYQRTGSQPGRYKHPFESPVRMYAMNDGSVLLRGSKRLHADDRERDFDQYVHPQHRRRNPMARRKRRASGQMGTGTWLLIGLGALLLLRPGSTGALMTGGGIVSQPNTSFWYSDPYQAGGNGAFFMGSLPPGSAPPWRLASQTEIVGLEDGMTTGMYSAAGGGLYVPFTESLAV